MARWHGTLAQTMGAVLVCASVATGQTETPLNATFRCANNAGCPVVGPPDAIQGDGVTQDGFTFKGYRTWSVSGKGKQTTVYLDGAFVNSAGGINIGLVPESTQSDRALQLRFAPPVVALPAYANAPTVCKPDGMTVLSNTVGFGFNIKDGETTLGIAALEDGGAVGYSGYAPQTAARWVIGLVTVVPAPNVQFDLFFNYSHDDITPYDGQVSLSRSGNTWTLTSDATVMLRCRVFPTTGKGAAKVYDVGTYHMPFQLTVQ